MLKFYRGFELKLSCQSGARRSAAQTESQAVNVAQPTAGSPAGLARMAGAPARTAGRSGGRGAGTGRSRACLCGVHGRTHGCLSSVGTYKIPAPASIDGTLHCTNTDKRAQPSIFTDIWLSGPRYALHSDADAARRNASVVLLTPRGFGHHAFYHGKGTYTFHLTAKVGSLDREPLQRTVTC